MSDVVHNDAHACMIIAHSLGIDAKCAAGKPRTLSLVEITGHQNITFDQFVEWLKEEDVIGQDESLHEAAERIGREFLASQGVDV